MLIKKTLFGENHADVATILINIGFLQNNLGNSTKAIEYNEQALAIWKTLYGEEHKEVVFALLSIGSIYFNLG